MKNSFFLLVPLFIFILFPFALAQEDPINMDSVTASVKLSNIIEINPQSADYRVSSVTADLSWVPAESYRQILKNIVTEPQAEILGDELHFRWDFPKEKELWVKVNGIVETTADYLEVNRKVNFPLSELDPGLAQYFKEQNIINFNDDIRDLAADLAEGKDDLYEVVFEIGKWVNKNIDYSLDTITAEAAQKSSWVLENKRGVCDELTSLFISMLRVLGIPARFVYGNAFTNTGELAGDWGPHGWAEVYFPGYGWVPFDVTYAEYGYVDAGHIKMGNSIDARKPSMKYSMKSRSAEIKSGFLDIDVDLIKGGNSINPGIELQGEFQHSEIGLSSYNLLTLHVKNTDNHYKPVSFKLAAPEEIRAEKPEIILLKPGEERKIHWIISIGKTLEPNYIYTFPVKITSDKGETLEASFRASREWISHEEEVFRQIVESEEKESAKAYSRSVELICEPDQNAIYANDEIKIICIIKNKGRQELKGANICYQDNCIKKNIDAGSEEAIEFPDSFGNPGLKNIIISAENPVFRKTSYSRVNVIDESALKIILDAPKEAKYGQAINVRFTVNKTSESTPQNLIVKMELQDSHQSWELNDLQRPRKFDVNIGTKGFSFNNEFTISVMYEDELGKRYNTKKKFKVKIVDLNALDWFIVSMNTLGYKIVSWLS